MFHENVNRATNVVDMIIMTQGDDKTQEKEQDQLGGIETT